MNLQMLKRAMLAYVSAVKFIWSSIAYPLSIVGKKLMNLRGYRVYGNSVQDGTPTPDSPIEIECVGDLTKNLFNPATAEYIGCSYNDGIISATVNENHIDVLLPAGQYTISCESNNAIYIRNGKVASGFISKKESSVTSVTINFPSDVDGYLRISFYGTTSYIKNLQIEEGTTATEYEPYHKYKIPVVARGKNMATAQQVYSTAANYFECIEDGRNCIRCASDGKSYAGINFKENTQYTVRFEAKTVARSGYEEDTSGEALFAFTHTDGTRKLIVVYGSKDWKYYEATSYANKTIASVGMYPYNYKHWIYVNVDTFQIEEGTTATTYEPYIAPITTNIFLDEPLRKVGDYADYIDYEKQKVVKRIYKYRLSDIPFNGKSGNTTSNSIYASYVYDSEVLKCKPNILISNEKTHDYIPLVLCEKLPPISWTTVANNRDIFGISVTESMSTLGNEIRISLPDSITTTLDGFKQWITENDCDVYTVYLDKFVEETLITLPPLPQFKGTAIYEVDTNIKPSGMEAKYC